MTTSSFSDGLIEVQRLLCKSTSCKDLEGNTLCAQFPDLLQECHKLQEDLKNTLNEGPPGVCLESKIILAIIYGVITSMSLVGNSLVIATFIFDKHMRSVTNVFILSLAVSDLMVTLTLVPFNVGLVFSKYWIFGRAACKMAPFFMTFSISSSSLTLCSISLDRYIAIIHPHKLKFFQSSKPAGLFLAIIWILSALCSVPNAIFYDVQRVEFTRTVPGMEDRYGCVWPESDYREPLQLWLTLVVLFITPLIFMSFAYCRMGYQLWIRKPVGSKRNTSDNTVMKKKVIKMLVIVMVAYVLCWSPIMVLNAVVELEPNAFQNSTVFIAYLKNYFQCLSLVSCCINPVIYTFMNRKFREKFATYLLCKRNKVHPVETKYNKTNPHGETHRTSLGGTMIPRDNWSFFIQCNNMDFHYSVC